MKSGFLKPVILLVLFVFAAQTNIAGGVIADLSQNDHNKHTQQKDHHIATPCHEETTNNYSDCCVDQCLCQGTACQSNNFFHTELRSDFIFRSISQNKAGEDNRYQSNLYERKDPPPKI